MNDDTKALWNYVNAVSDLAEAVKVAITRGDITDTDIVLALNDLTKAANEVAYLTDALQKTKVRMNQ